MKRIIKIIVLSLVATTLVGILITGMTEDLSLEIKGLSFGYFFDEKGYNKGGFTTDQIITDIEIDWVAGNVLIESYDGDVVSVSEDGVDGEDNQLCYKIKDNTLTIKFQKSYFIFSSINTKKDLIIKIPRDMAADLKELEYDGAEALVTVRKLSFDSVEIDCASGNLIVEDCSFDIINCSAVSANLEFDNCVAKEISLESVSGNIDYLGEVERLDMNSVSGEILCRSTGIINRLDVETVSGKIKLFIQKDNGFDLDFSNITGNFTFNGDHQKDVKNYMYGNMSADFNVESVSGDLEITIVEQEEEQ